MRLRIARQALLTRAADPPALRLMLNEAVLRRPVEGNAVMAGKLGHLVEASQRLISEVAGSYEQQR
ncbi:Scr1 family TA system antitoxin-like transcriptional regulator [Streptomyces sp. H27-D2]|uniref:Scr1 family TA system antitoxin-like transcriptional regulator n=1 Tax=Streptomyces sp. H27-D2 TaxID=3046304 RepID=UPI003FA684DF